MAQQPYEVTLRSKGYARARAEHPAELVPASVFFTHDDRSALDRRASLRVKAALVYEVITGQHDASDELRARLLLALAGACHSFIHGQTPKIGSTPDEKIGNMSVSTPKDGSTPPDEKIGNVSTKNLTDEGWDGERKRVLDAVFLVVGFLPMLKDAVDRSTDRKDVDESFKSCHMLDIVADVIKLENQLPLQVLRKVMDVVDKAIQDTVSRPEFEAVKKLLKDKYKLVSAAAFPDVVQGFCWYYSPFSAKKGTAAQAGQFKDVAADPPKTEETHRTLLDCLYQSVQPAPGKEAAITGRPSRMPAARELRQSGVRLQVSENGRAEIEVQEQRPAVVLPALAYDFKLATVARNLLAWEYGEQSKPVTRYFQMMNELVVDDEDARILRRAGVVRGGSKGAKEVHALIKNIDGNATYPSVYMPLDREIDKVKQQHEQRMKNFFVRNRPGVIWAASVATVSVVAIAAARKKQG